MSWKLTRSRSSGWPLFLPSVTCCFKQTRPLVSNSQVCHHLPRQNSQACYGYVFADPWHFPVRVLVEQVVPAPFLLLRQSTALGEKPKNLRPCSWLTQVPCPRLNLLHHPHSPEAENHSLSSRRTIQLSPSVASAAAKASSRSYTALACSMGTTSRCTGEISARARSVAAAEIPNGCSEALVVLIESYKLPSDVDDCSTYHRFWDPAQTLYRHTRTQPSPSPPFPFRPSPLCHPLPPEP